MVSPMQKKAAVEIVVCTELCKRQRACRTLSLSRSTAYYRRLASPQKLAQEGLVEEVSRQWPCLSYEKVAAIVCDEHGEVINRKWVARIRRQRGLMASGGHGGNVRILLIIGEYTRECLLLKAARSFPERRVIDALQEVMVCSERKTQYVRSDNGPEPSELPLRPTACAPVRAGNVPMND